MLSIPSLLNILKKHLKKYKPKQIHSNTILIKNQKSLILNSFKYSLQKKHTTKLSIPKNNSQIQIHIFFLHKHKIKF